MIYHLLPFPPALIKALIDDEFIGPRMILDNVWKGCLNTLLHGTFEIARKEELLHGTQQLDFYLVTASRNLTQRILKCL